MNLDLTNMQAELIKYAINKAWSDMNEEAQEIGKEILDAITRDRGCGGAAYTLSFECYTNWTTELISAAIQSELFFDGSALSAHYHDESIRLREDGRWEVELLREDCESDYHNCYDPDHGHDGSDAAAIAQVMSELKEGLYQATLTSNHKIEARRRLGT
jgi:hypothetical protein